MKLNLNKLILIARPKQIMDTNGKYWDYSVWAQELSKLLSSYHALEINSLIRIHFFAPT